MRFELTLGLYYYCPDWLSDTGIIQTIDRIDWRLLE
jgi:hypothetical protein